MYIINILILLLASSCSQFSPKKRSGQYPFIKDPNNLLFEIDKFIGWTSFEDTFRCGSKFVFQMNSCAKRCEPFYCESVCEPKKKEIVTTGECTGNSVSFLNNGKVWFKVKKERYFDFNWIRAWLSAPIQGAYGKPGERIGKKFVTIEKVVPEKFKIGKKVFDTLRVYIIYSYFNESIKKYSHSYQSVVVGKSNETGGMFLEHMFYENKEPVSRIINLKIGR